MIESIPTEIIEQVSQACAVIERHLSSTLLAIHLFGSAVVGGLKPSSDIDLLVTVSAPPGEATRQALLLDLLTVSAPPGEDKILRALEVTVIVHDEVVPWRYPPRREAQFGEWLRKEFLAGIFAPAVLDIDLAILITIARQHSIAVVGPTAEELFEPVPEGDYFKVLSDRLKLSNSAPDWSGDERNVVLTIARIWYSVATGKIAPKDVAAGWVLERLPVEYQPVLREAQQAYLGQGEDHLAAGADQVAALILYSKSAIFDLLETRKT